MDFQRFQKINANFYAGHAIAALRPFAHPEPVPEDKQREDFDRFQAFTLSREPRLGDFVKVSLGGVHRIASFHENGTIQTAYEDQGICFIRGTSFLSYSGGFSPYRSSELSRLKPTDETMFGRVWTFHNNEVRPGYRIDCKIPFRVWELLPE